MNKRQQIVDTLTEMMTDVRGVKQVAVWKATEFAPAEYPVILIRDMLDSMPSDGAIGRIDHELEIDLTAMFFGATSASEAREMAALIMASLGTNPTFDGVAYDTVVNSAELDVDEFGKKVSSVTILITVFYRSELWTI